MSNVRLFGPKNHNTHFQHWIQKTEIVESNLADAMLCPKATWAGIENEINSKNRITVLLLHTTKKYLRWQDIH